MLNIIKLLRPQQYIKNLFIFLPLFFAMKITDTAALLSATIAFIAFSLTASAIYTLNDFHDIEEDRQHPKKKTRPLASGSITKPQAINIMLLLFVVGMGLMSTLDMLAVSILVAYIILNVCYSLYLKHVAILDVTTIAIGFVLRIFVGSAATDVPLSRWIIIMTFLLALFMALAKRRDDVLIYLDTGKKMRKVIDGYSLQFIDTAMGIMASVVIVAYTNSCTSTEIVEKFNSEHLYLTVLFVILGIMRYLLITFVLKDSGSPTQIVLKDRFIQCTLVGWIATFTGLIYV